MNAARWLAVVAIAAVALSACTTATTTAPSATAAASTSPSPELPAIVGEWERITRCEEIVQALQEEELDRYILEFAAAFSPSGEVSDPEEPCAGAVPLRHSHFFTETLRFGSRDENGNQVDDGFYRVEGDTIIISTELFGDTTFGLEINGDELALEPAIPDCRPECFASVWSVSVAYPGHTWTRVK